MLYLEKLFGTLLVAGQVVMAQLRERLRVVSEGYHSQRMLGRLHQPCRICDMSHMRYVPVIWPILRFQWN